MKKVSILIVLVLGCFIESKAQKVALKSNLLYGRYDYHESRAGIRTGT